MQQTSYVYDADGYNLFSLGTMAVFGDTEWSNVDISLDVMSANHGGIGVVFRAADTADYYRFRWDWARLLPSLEKITRNARAAQVLDDSDVAPYTPNAWYHFDLLCSGAFLRVSISGGALAGPVVLSAVDTAIRKGAAGLYSWDCNSANFDNIVVSSVAADTVPPAAITDFSATTGSSNKQISLSWTAPGDDGKIGKAGRYDIRFSNTPIITLGDFLSAKAILYAPRPESSSTVQSLIVTVSDTGKLFYFGIRACDKSANWSGLSNPASAIPYFNPGEKKWYKGQMHCHTTYSDGDVSPGKCAALYKAAGYDFLGISDHAESQMTPAVVTRTEIYDNPSFLTFPNSEVSYAAHMNALNLSGDTIPYYPIASLQQDIDLVLSTGAVCQINHPYCSYLTPASVLNTHGAPLMEVLQQWDATHSYYRSMDGMVEDARVWDSVLSAGRQIYGTGTDDAHHYPAEVDWGWIEVYATSLELHDILSAIMNGDFYASTGPEISSIVTHDRTLEVTSRDGVQIKFIGKNGVVLDSVKSNAAGFALPGTGLYVRAVVTNAGGKVAYTQAFFPSPGTRSIGGAGNKTQNLATPCCHPNPFNPAITFTCSIAGQGLHPVRLEIFDVKGAKIKTLVQSHPSPGEYSETWTGRDDYGNEAGSGVYLYRLVLDNKSYPGSILKIK